MSCSSGSMMRKKGFSELAKGREEETLLGASIEGKTALHFAAESGNVHLVESLLKNGGHLLNEKSEIGWTALHYAVKKGDFQMVKMLALWDEMSCINEEDFIGRTPFLMSSRFAPLQIVKFLAERGADLRAKDKNGNDAFFLACYGGKLENVEYLHHLGAFDIEKRNKLGATPLLLATVVDEVQTMELLLELGADIEGQGGFYNATPLITAAYYSKLETFKFLLEKGANLDARDKLDADVFMRACDGDKLETMEFLLQIKKYDLERRNVNGKTAWIKAAKKSSIEVKKYLVELGANIHAVDKLQLGALILAAKYSNPANCKFMVDIGLSFDVLTNEGGNALHVACLSGNLSTAEFFLGLRPLPLDVNARMRDGKTALDIAHKKGCQAMIDLLLRHGATSGEKIEKAEIRVQKRNYSHPLYSSNWRQ